LFFHGEIGHSAPELRVFLLQILELFRLFDLQTPVFFSPAIEGLLDDPGLLAGLVLPWLRSTSI